MYLYLCSGDFIPTSDSIHGGHWFARRSSFPVWFRWNFLILLLSVDLNAALPQPSQVATAHLAPHVASGSFYLSCLYFCVCSPPTLIGVGGGGRRPPGLLVSPRVLHVVLYLFIIYYFSLFWLYTYMQFLWAIQCLAFIYLCGPLGPFRIMLCIDVTVRFFFSCAGTKGLPSTKMPCSVWPQHRIRLEKIAK